MSVRTSGLRTNFREQQLAPEVRGALLRQSLRDLDFLATMEITLGYFDPLSEEIRRVMDARPDLHENSAGVLREWGLWFQCVLEMARRRVC